MGETKFKFNSGNFAILCSDCGKIVKTGQDFTKEEWDAMQGVGDLGSIYCDGCKPKHKEEKIGTEEKTIPLDFVKNVLPFLENEELKHNLLNSIVKNKLNLDILNGNKLGSDN